MLSNIINDKTYTRTRSPRHIILCPLHNMIVHGTVYEPNMLQSSYKYTWGMVQEYFYKRLSMKQPPFHFYSEFLEDDYVFYVGTGISQSAGFLRILAGLNAIKYEYRDALLICLNEDFRLDPLETRLAEGICNFLIAPLQKQFGIDRNHVVFFDDILTNDADMIMMTNKDLQQRFMIEKSKYYDHNILQFVLKRYGKK